MVRSSDSLLLISHAGAAGPTHLALTREELAAFVVGVRTPSTSDALSQLDSVLDRSHRMPPGAVEFALEGMKAGKNLEP